jgi:RNA polymerase sigma-70 factor (ECF subfamily)
MVGFGKDIKLRDFEKLYFDHYGMLCQSIYRFVKNEEASKDIVQEVFVKFWKRQEELDDLESRAAYLRRACINAAINYLKERDRRQHRELRFAKDVSDESTDRPDQQLQTKETQKNINHAIDQLPSAPRNAFLLSRYESKSYKEIADILNISVSTVEKHMGKALKLLRKSLSPTG